MLPPLVIDHRHNLRAEVKFSNREPASTMQKVLSLFFAIAVVAIPCMLIAAMSLVNVELKGDCSPCSSGFISTDPLSSCTPLCIGTKLAADLASCSASKEVTGRQLAATDYQKGIFALMGSPAVFSYFIVMLLGASLWLLALRVAAKCMVWSTIVISMGVAGYAYYLTHNWMFLVGIVLIGGGAAYKKELIGKGCESMTAALEALAETRHAFLVLVAIQVLALCLAASIIGIISFASRIWAVDSQCQLHVISMSFQTPLAFLFFIVFNFFNMVACYAISYAIGCWYFHSDDPAVPFAPILSGTHLALLTPNGVGVCVQASLVMSLVDYLQNKTKASKSWKACCDPTFCLAFLLMACFRQCLQSLTKFAVVAVALVGGGFCETSHKAMDTLGSERTANFVIIDGVISSVLRSMATAFSVVLAISCWATIDAVEGLGIFAAIINGTEQIGGIDPKMAQYLVVAIILAFVYFVRKPFFTIAIIFIVNSYATIQNTIAASAMAALIMGSVASLVFHYFAECVIGAQCAMFYCYSLESALHGDAGVPGAARRRAKVGSMWAQQQALNLPDSTFTVVCPQGAVPGTMLSVTSPGGQTMQVMVPGGIQPGQVFAIQLQSAPAV